ncbi:hypothetical protein EVAR_28131_1 [Eumeta japonica]|uniref:Uncharacterized protein n=1 Tax=Eumeta variegata TaxID=151549 RepID=A0A4C1VE21_EUMVA|nr:hypothetical protein EVAR_28131_1 [Eumeta japonica]
MSVKERPRCTRRGQRAAGGAWAVRARRFNDLISGCRAWPAAGHRPHRAPSSAVIVYDRKGKILRLRKGVLSSGRTVPLKNSNIIDATPPPARSLICSPEHTHKKSMASGRALQASDDEKRPS